LIGTLFVQIGQKWGSLRKSTSQSLERMGVCRRVCHGEAKGAPSQSILSGQCQRRCLSECWRKDLESNLWVFKATCTTLVGAWQIM